MVATADQRARTKEQALALLAKNEGMSLLAATRSGHSVAWELKREMKRGRRARRARERSFRMLIATPAATTIAMRAKLAATLPLVEGELTQALLHSLARDLRLASRTSSADRP